VATIVVVNDEEELLEMCADLLRDHGHRVFATCHPEQAPGLVQDHRPDVLLLDLIVPRSSGEQVLQSVVQRVGRVPLVVMSASADGAERARKMGAQAFLPKPFDEGALLAAVERAIHAAPSA
jgi:DNA-binding NtrC family response regulator